AGRPERAVSSWSHRAVPHDPRVDTRATLSGETVRSVVGARSRILGRRPGRYASGRLFVEPVLPELAPERRAPDAQGFRRPRMIPAAAFEGLDDLDPLGLGQGLLASKVRRWTEGEPRGHVGRQVVGLNALRLRENGGALHDVLELADVARPGIPEQPVHRGRAQAQGAALPLGEPAEEML